MIQDIEPYEYSNLYFFDQPPANDSILFCFNEQSVLLKEENGEIQFPCFADWTDKDVNFTYLFSISGQAYYLADSNTGIALPGYQMGSIRLFRTAAPRHMAFAGITAFQLHNWYQNHRFCGKCGHEMKPGAKERMVYCENCNHIEYPKIAPAAIVAVTDGDKLLMSRYAQGTYKKYALLAGFTEIGETIEKTVEREVMEEVGLRVKNIRYYKSQPWSFSDTLLLGFFAELDGDATIKIDENELESADWFTREEIQVEADGLSLTNEMILAFKNEMPADNIEK